MPRERCFGRASETHSLRTKQEDVFYKINHIFVERTVQHCMQIHAVRVLCSSRPRSDFRQLCLVHSYPEMASPTFSLTDILIRGRQTNSQVIVSGVRSRHEKKIGTPDLRLSVSLRAAYTK